MTVVLMRTDKINKFFRIPTGRGSASGKNARRTFKNDCYGNQRT